MTPAEKGKLTRERNAAARAAKRETDVRLKETARAALERVFMDESASPETVIRAAELLIEVKKMY